MRTPSQPTARSWARAVTGLVAPKEVTRRRLVLIDACVPARTAEAQKQLEELLCDLAVAPSGRVFGATVEYLAFRLVEAQPRTPQQTFEEGFRALGLHLWEVEPVSIAKTRHGLDPRTRNRRTLCNRKLREADARATSLCGRCLDIRGALGDLPAPDIDAGAVARAHEALLTEHLRALLATEDFADAPHKTRHVDSLVVATGRLAVAELLLAECQARGDVSLLNYSLETVGCADVPVYRHLPEDVWRIVDTLEVEDLITQAREPLAAAFGHSEFRTGAQALSHLHDRLSRARAAERAAEAKAAELREEEREARRRAVQREAALARL